MKKKIRSLASQTLSSSYNLSTITSTIKFDNIGGYNIRSGGFGYTTYTLSGLLSHNRKYPMRVDTNYVGYATLSNLNSFGSIKEPNIKSFKIVGLFASKTTEEYNCSDTIFLLLYKPSSIDNDTTDIPTNVELIYNGVKGKLKFVSYIDRDMFLNGELMTYSIDFGTYDENYNYVDIPENKDFKPFYNDLLGKNLKSNIEINISDFVKIPVYKKGKSFKFNFKIPNKEVIKNNYTDISFVIKESLQPADPDTNYDPSSNYSELYSHGDLTVNSSDNEFLLKYLCVTKFNTGNYALRFTVYLKNESNTLNYVPYDICMYDDSIININGVNLTVLDIKNGSDKSSADSVGNLGYHIRNHFTIANQYYEIKGVFSQFYETKAIYKNTRFIEEVSKYGSRYFNGLFKVSSSKMASIYDYFKANPGKMCEMTITL